MALLAGAARPIAAAAGSTKPLPLPLTPGTAGREGSLPHQDAHGGLVDHTATAEHHVKHVAAITGAKPSSGEQARAHAHAHHQARQASRERERMRNQMFIGYNEGGAPQHSIVLTTNLGIITITPRSDLSPATVARVMALASSADARHGEINRHEPVPPGEGPPLEGNPSLVRGDVAMVPGSMTFVIALAEHPEWGNSHTLWGKIESTDSESWETLSRIPTKPYTNLTDGPITTRWLQKGAVVPLRVQVAAAAPRRHLRPAPALGAEVVEA
ncbi:hypothetical protein MNEG_13586 [Monoraphidium neglectum]|uniref:Uncharacterized protein n=1 Tax=Monoraphidium neglectum TaxID=145388 RepID=A0A0D2LY13_9CHLO|nr:hypothetical protein MNEG_13586 [Monoraphidium neglectum]KIY94376.1 hypothetical protein MNEG_13586 [Monoraphidium neglectum]|eukprot:XP_013893396.1 hypothetical protein MNEG_13586 [Monoraphidium neglectum]